MAPTEHLILTSGAFAASRRMRGRGLMVRDGASRSLSSGVHSRDHWRGASDELPSPREAAGRGEDDPHDDERAFAPPDDATHRLENHEAAREAAMIRANRKMLETVTSDSP